MEAGSSASSSAGFVSSIGLGMNSPSYVAQILQQRPDVKFDTVMLAGSFNLLNQSGLPTLIECQRQGTAVHNAGVFASGLLAGGGTVDYAPASEGDRSKAGHWGQLARRHGCTLMEAALAFAQLPSCVEAVAVGVCTPAQVEAAVAAALRVGDVPAQLWRDAEGAGLLAPGVLGKF